MDLYNKAKLWFGRKAVRGALLLAILFMGAYMAVSTRNAETEVDSESSLPLVAVTTAQQFAGESTINLIGTVRAFSEASITSEKTGRVTSVRVALGDTVTAGTIIATLENASENASVLSAQGSYEASLAAAAQSEISVDSAQTQLTSAQDDASTAYQNAYNTVNGVVLNNVDIFYRNPDGIYPSLRIASKGNSEYLRTQRISIQSVLATWRANVNSKSTISDSVMLLKQAQTDTATIIGVIDALTDSIGQADDSSTLDGVSVRSYLPALVSARASLIATQTNLRNVITKIDVAKNAVTQAQLSASTGNTTSSTADAQVKQALGSLRSAQAQLAKTIIRTPISGTVNSMNIRTGDFINSFAQVAEVANNNALEVVTFAGEKDRTVISVGDTVLIENKFNGIVTEVAPAVDAGTGKTEVRIASESEDLQNGDSVQITKEVVGSGSADVIIPLSAVKFALSDGSVFIVEDGRLVSRAVTLGTIRGGSVEILEGLGASEEFIADARGLVESTEVEVIR